MVTALIIMTLVTLRAAPASASPSDGNPWGSLDVVAVTQGTGPVQVRVAGWAVDPDTGAPINVDVYANNVGIQRLTAGTSRPDIANAYPGYGPNHGFDATLTIPEGVQSVCAFAINVGRGSANPLIGCRSVTVSNSPFGNIDVVQSVAGGVRVAGWVIDPNVSDPVPVDIYVNGTVVPRFNANVARPDVSGFGKGPNHGFDTTVPKGAGTYTVCVWAVNLGAGSVNPELGCRSITVGAAPVGSLDSVLAVVDGGVVKVRVTGWAIDPSTSTPIYVDVYGNNNTGLQRLTANLPRPDVAAAYPGYGPAHGFDAVLSIGDGDQNVCAYAINAGSGATNPRIGCAVVHIQNNPIGRLDTVSQIPGKVRVAGWAIDPNTSAPINVDVYINGVDQQRILANGSRPDIGAAYPGAGPNHGFDTTYTLGNGQYQVCLFGINVGAGDNNPLLGCTTITTSFSPYGNLDSVNRAGAAAVSIGGWATDPDATGPITVVFTADGTSIGQTTTSVARPDVHAAYPAVPTDSGFTATLPVDANRHSVCATVVNQGPGADTSLGCLDLASANATVPAPPRAVTASPGYNQTTITWQAPATDNGSSVRSYTITPYNGQRGTAGTVTVPASTTSYTFVGLPPGTAFYAMVQAANAIGKSSATGSNATTTFTAPPPQQTPPIVSTSRYIRNLTGGSGDISFMYSAGAADASRNASNHSYITLLDIGGQYNGGVVLSATSTWVSYSTLVQAINAYLDGYHSQQQPYAPATIAIGTNNDWWDNSTGTEWAQQVVNPVVSHAVSYQGMTIAGANDIEPGFRQGPSAVGAWLSSYLAATSAPFINNGSADGCAWTTSGAGCNNGWTMGDLYWVAGGAAPGRIMNLPQIYNNTMAAQWKYISLTGVASGGPPINFGGPLTELTACQQAGSCGSLDGVTAWNALWNQLQSDARIAQGSLPWATDLRIN